MLALARKMRAIFQRVGLDVQSIVWRTLLLQSAVICLAVVVGFVWNLLMLRAALLAGVVALFPALAYARLIRHADRAPLRIVVRLHLLGELVRLVLSIALLVVAFVFLKSEFSIPYFFGTYVMALAMYGVVLVFK